MKDGKERGVYVLEIPGCCFFFSCFFSRSIDTTLTYLFKVAVKLFFFTCVFTLRFVFCSRRWEMGKENRGPGWLGMGMGMEWRSFLLLR